MIRMPRTLSLPDGDVSMLPPVAHYDCLRVESPLVIDGRLDEAVWARVEWSGAFVKMDTGAPVSLKSQIALLWDDVALYAGFRFEDGDIWGTHVEHHDHVYHRDSDAELFIHGEGVYYEIGINPINTVYEVLWTWLEPVVARQDVKTLNRLLSTEHGLYFTPRRTDRIGRFGETDWQWPGLRHGVHVQGHLNNPRLRDEGWTVELALPWKGLHVLGRGDGPPRAGDVWRIGASRCQHFREASDSGERETGELISPSAGWYEDWSWNAHGFINMHIPERWSKVRFDDAYA